MRFWGSTWNDLKPFDIVDIDEIVERYIQSYTDIANTTFDAEDEVVVNWLNNSWLGSPHKDIGPHIQQNFSSVYPTAKFVYVELPYKFYKEFMTDWLYGSSQQHIDDGSIYPLRDIKKHIQSDTRWGTVNDTGCCSYSNYRTFKKYGIAHPVFNNSFLYPKRNTHRTAFCAYTDSDIPAFLLCSNRNGIEFNRFRILPNIHENPYFGGKYLEMVVNIPEKYIDFIIGNKVVGKYQAL